MGTEYGKNWRLQIGDAATPTEDFDAIGGEISFDWQRQTQEFDDSTKDDGDYGSTSVGQQKITINCNGNLKLPDTGLERVATVAKTSPCEANVKIMKGAIVKFHGRVVIGNFSTTFGKDGPSTYQFVMMNKGAPIVDNLGAVAP